MLRRTGRELVPFPGLLLEGCMAVSGEGKKDVIRVTVHGSTSGKASADDEGGE